MHFNCRRHENLDRVFPSSIRHLRSHFPFVHFIVARFNSRSGLALFQILALVECLLALADAERHFHFSVLPVKRQREQRVALHRRQPEQFPDFRFVQEQFARRLGT